MKEILLGNPSRKGRAKKKAVKRKAAKPKKQGAKALSKPKAGKTMAKKKGKKKSYKRNPASLRTVGGLNIPRAAIDATKCAGGMLIAQFFAKKFAKGGGANNVNWDAKNYGFAALGALAAGLAGNLIKKGSGQEMFKGGLALVMYKLVTNEIAPKSDWLEAQLGQFDELNPAYQAAGYLPEADIEEMDVMEDYEYLLGEGNVYAPAEDEFYPNMGEPVVPVSSLGEAITEVSDLGEDPYSAAFYN